MTVTQVPMPGISSEADLQRFADELLAASSVTVYRLPDKLWHWLNCAPINEGVRIWLRKLLGGWPDLSVFLPIGNGYHLCAPIELKRHNGYLRSSQKVGKLSPWIVCRTPEEILAAITEAAAMAEKIKASHAEKGEIYHA